MSELNNHVYEFGPFRLDASDHLVFRGDELVSLPPKAVELLAVLVANGGRVLSKEELLNRVWPETHVEEANLSHQIYKLREALGDDGSGEKYIQTLPRRGYRFVAKVTVQDPVADLIFEEHSRAQIVVEVDDEPEKIPETQIARAEERLTLPAHVQRLASPKQLLFIGGSVVLIGLVVGFIYFSRARETHAVSGAPLRSIAVLPFKPLVANDRDESLEMGMAETLITRLSNLHQITVRPTSSVRKYKDLEQDSVAAGRALNVDSVLDGNIQKAGNRLRVTARLVRVADGATIWTDKFDTEITGLFAVQDSIAEKVVGALALRLTGEQQKGLSKRYTDNVEAYQLYLQGRYHWSTFKNDDLLSSINFYRAALEKDPNYALAYTGLAVSYSTIGVYGPLPVREAQPKALEAAQKAVELDDQLAEAHVALGVVKLFAWDWEGAHREFERGIQLNPSTTGRTPYGYYLYTMGRWDEAIRELKYTTDLNPGWQLASCDLWWALYASRRYDETAEQVQQAIRLDPNDGCARWILGQTQLQKRMYKEAIATLQAAHEIDGKDLKVLADLGYAYAITGDKNGALRVVAELKRSPASIALYLIAEIYAGLGDKNQAFAWLDKAYEERFPFLCDFKVTPQFDDLRSDPRYAQLAQRMNLSP